MTLNFSRAAACRPALRAALAGVIGAAGLAILCLPSPAAAQEPYAFTIPADDGYGIADCMQAGSACGQAMATSWCEAHGHPHAAAFGMAEDVTGTVPAAASSVDPAITHAAVLIRCTD